MADQHPELASKLFKQIPTGELEQETNLLMEQYKLYVEMADKVSERRHQTNSFFLTVNTILIIVLTGFISQRQQSVIQVVLIMVAMLAGVVFCLIWRRLIQAYGQLSSIKFKIIHLLETYLPAKLFDAEWDALDRGEGAVYRPFSHTEVRVPLIFALLYVILGVLALLETLF